MKRLLLVAMLLASPAFADGIEGWGHVSVGGGFRWVPNWWFFDHAAAAGTPVIPGITGGPQATASFGYGVTRLFELSIDLLGSFETFSLALPDGNRDEYTSSVYGAQLGGRLQGVDVFFKGFMPYLQVQAGPLLSNISVKSQTIPEKVVLAFSVSGGITYRFSEKYGLGVEVRYLNARSNTPISGINVGGVLFSAMFTFYFPPEPKRDLDVPGF